MVDLFIIFFLLVCIGYDLPQGHLLRYMVKPLHPLILYTGLAHSWRMFAPNVATSSYKLVGLIYLQNGEQIFWGGRFLHKLSWSQSWLWMRHRKWETCMLQMAPDDVRAGFCRLLASRYRAAGLDPVRIELGREETKIFYPGEEPDEFPDPQRTMLCAYDVTNDCLIKAEEQPSTLEPTARKAA